MIWLITAPEFPLQEPVRIQERDSYCPAFASGDVMPAVSAMVSNKAAVTSNLYRADASIMTSLVYQDTSLGDAAHNVAPGWSLARYHQHLHPAHQGMNRYIPAGTHHNRTIDGHHTISRFAGSSSNMPSPEGQRCCRTNESLKYVKCTPASVGMPRQQVGLTAARDAGLGIVHETSLQRELHVILTAFDAGLQTLLLRKPGWPEHAYARWLSFLPENYRQHVMVSSFPALVESFGLKGLHLSEDARRQIAPYEIRKLRETGKWVSASIHDDAADTSGFDFALQGPVFDSLSKPGHAARPFRHIPSNAIALGGVQEENVRQVREMGYCGAAVLGAAWQQPEKAAGTILTLINKWKQ